MASVTLTRSGIVLGDELLPLRAGSVHYWQLERRDWRACLAAVRELGLRLVDVYVPWAVHEHRPGEFDFGQGDPLCDLPAFLRLAHELELLAIVRPGPSINAELTYFGIPERVIWDGHCQARSPKGNPVISPMLPKMFPIPSYASEAYRDEVGRYFQALGQALGPLRYPDGPLVLLQVDNGGSLFLRDGIYEQDYHPDAIRQYRQFLRRRYGTISALREAYPITAVQADAKPASEEAEEAEEEQAEELEPAPALRFANVDPPRCFDVTRAEELVRHLDWAEFQEEMMVNAMSGFVKALQTAGLEGIPISYGLPLAQDKTSLSVAGLGKAVDMVGLNYHGRATSEHRCQIARRTTELAVACEAEDRPAFACEMAAGFPPYVSPHDEGDHAFTVLTALAYGLRGFNVYMAVERDRWIGAPLDTRGRPRPFAEFWRQLCTALDRVDFHRLRRRVPVRLLMPAHERRIARVMNGFGPLSGELLGILGQGARESCVEDELGLGYPLAIEAETFARGFEQALEARGVPFAFVGGDDPVRSLEGARWVVCATSGGLSDGALKSLQAAHEFGARLTVGPRPVCFNASMRTRLEPDWTKLGADLMEGSDPARIDAAVGAAIASLALPRYACDPDNVQATIHEDEAGQAQLVFVIQAEPSDVMTRVTVGEDAIWTDLFDERDTRSRDGVLELMLKGRSVRMLARTGTVTV